MVIRRIDMRGFGKAKLAVSMGAVLAGVLASPAAAESNSYDVMLRAYVPIECEADIDGSVSALSNQSFSLGNVRQYCNAPFQMSIMHQALNTTAQLQFKSNLVAVGSASTLVQSSTSATDSNAPLVLHGVNMAEAENFAASMTLAVTPLGV
jgi:hypothetical protein